MLSIRARKTNSEAIVNVLFSERYLMILAIKTKPIHEQSRKSEERI